MRLGWEAKHVMQAMTFPGIMWRGGKAIALATAATCLYCAIAAAETVPFGMFINLFVVPSVAIFLLLEKTCAGPFPKYAGFFLPLLVVAGVCLGSVWRLRQQAMTEGLSDGSADMIVYFVQGYGIGSCFAFASLLWDEFRRKSQRDHS